MTSDFLSAMSHFIWVMNVKGCCFFDPMNWNIAVLDYFPLQIKCWYQSSLYITSASPLNSFMKRWRSHSILDMILYGTETLGFDMCCICVSILSLIDGYFGTQLLSPEWPKYQVDVSIWILKHIYSKLQYNVCKCHWYPTEKLSDDLPSFGEKNLEIHSQNRGHLFNELRTITSSGSGDTLAVSRDSNLGISSCWDLEFWFQDFETFGVSW